MKSKILHIIHLIVFEVAVCGILLAAAAFFKNSPVVCFLLITFTWVQGLIVVYYTHKIDKKGIDDFENETHLNMRMVNRFSSGDIVAKDGKFVKIVKEN